MTRQMADDEVLRVLDALADAYAVQVPQFYAQSGKRIKVQASEYQAARAAVAALQAERDALREKVAMLDSEVRTRTAQTLANGQAASVAELRADIAESALEALRGQVAGLGWIKPSDRLPEDGTECLVVAQYGSDPKPYVSVDTWQMQREAPLEFSSCTVEIGLAWDDHDFLDVLLWKPIVRPSAEELDAALLAIKERVG